MQAFKKYFNFDQTMGCLIVESDIFEINLIVYITRFFQNIKNEIDLFVEENLTIYENYEAEYFNICINKNREEILEFIDINESECILRCRENRKLYQAKLDSILRLTKQLRGQFPSENFVINQEFLKKISEIKKLSIEFRKDLFKRNFIFLKPVDNINSKFTSNNKSKFFVIEPFCMDDWQIEFLK